MSAVLAALPPSGAGATASLAATPTPPPAAVPEPEPIPKYNFDSHFQTKIAALVCRDSHFMMRVDGLIRPEYFADPAEASLVSSALRYYGKYRKIPASGAVWGNVIRDDVLNKVIRTEMGLMMGKKLTELLGHDISDRDYVIDKVAVFARHQAVAKAMEQSIMVMDKGDFAKIAEVMQKALSVGANVDASVYDFSESIGARTAERLDKAAGLLPPTGITTGYEQLDNVLYHKGWGRQELSVLMGGAKAGKTTALIDFGINAWAAGFNVGYFTLEVSAKIIGARMDANISDTEVAKLGVNPHDVRQKVGDFFARANAKSHSGAGAKFLIQEYPTGTLTVSDIRRTLERWRAKGTKIDLLIVDYADLMAPERFSDNAIENSKSVYIGLRGLAMQEDIAVLTATQTNREGYKAQVARVEHIAEDFNKVRIADIIISINRTDEERAAKQARLFFAACRNQEGGFTIRVEQDPGKMKFIKKIVGFE